MLSASIHLTSLVYISAVVITMIGIICPSNEGAPARWVGGWVEARQGICSRKGGEMRHTHTPALVLLYPSYVAM